MKKEFKNRILSLILIGSPFLTSFPVDSINVEMQNRILKGNRVDHFKGFNYHPASKNFLTLHLAVANHKKNTGSTSKIKLILLD